MKTTEKNAQIMRGVELVGMCTDPRVNEGAPVPVFISKARTDGSPSINTLEGWNAVAEKQNRRSFISAFGREPVDRAEVDAWIQTLISE